MPCLKRELCKIDANLGFLLMSPESVTREDKPRNTKEKSWRWICFFVQGSKKRAELERGALLGLQDHHWTKDDRRATESKSTNDDCSSRRGPGVERFWGDNHKQIRILFSWDSFYVPEILKKITLWCPWGDIFAPYKENPQSLLTAGGKGIGPRADITLSSSNSDW